MRRLFTILTLTALITGCSWMWENVPGRAEEKKPPTPAEQIESLTQTVLDFKFKLGAEMQISAQEKARSMMLQKKLKEANAKIAQLEMKPKEGKDEATD